MDLTDVLGIFTDALAAIGVFVLGVATAAWPFVAAVAALGAIFGIVRHYARRPRS